MNTLDIIIILGIISAIFRGKDLGLVRQFCSTAGFIGGLFIGSLLVPHTISLGNTPGSRSAVTLATTLGSALIGLVLGEYLGIYLKRKVQNWRIDRVDAVLGSLLGVLTLLGTVWLSAAILGTLPAPGVQTTIHNSRIISRLHQSLPPATEVLSGLGRLIDPNGFPRVFTGNEPSPPQNTTIPGISTELQQAVDRDNQAVVRLEGRGCGGLVEGSGFVIAGDLVATNAHVVAGVNQPYVIDTHGQHSTKLIWFDKDLDFAILRVPNLEATPLALSTRLLPKDTPAAVLGYPGGGPLRANGARVLDQFAAIGRDIYGRGSSQRDIYELAATVIPGNSGGPLIGSDGSVFGIIFARSTAYDNVGYALTTPQIDSAVSQAQSQNRTVGSGDCAE